MYLAMITVLLYIYSFFFSSRRRHTRYWRDWSSDVCSSDLRGLDIPDGLSEFDTLAEMERLAHANRPAGAELVCFAGAGAYDHEIPSEIGRASCRERV